MTERATTDIFAGLPAPQTAPAGALVDPSRAGALAGLFFGLIKSRRMYSVENDAYKRQMSKFWDIFDEICGPDGRMSLKVITGRLLLNDQLCRFSHGALPPGADSAIEQWREVDLGGVEFGRSQATLDGILALLTQNFVSEADRERVKELLCGGPVDGAKFYRASEFDISDQEVVNRREQMRSDARKIFHRSLSAATAIFGAARLSKEVGAGEAQRCVQSLIDHIETDAASLIELAAIHSYDDYTFAHSVNVCVYSLMIGVRLDLDRARLSELGFAALFHDIGKARLPIEVVRKPGRFDENDWAQMRRHPLLGARILLRNFPIDRYSIRGAIGAFEHHINLDNSGYPARVNPKPLNLFSRIITIADTFDALTSGRVYITEKISPVEIIRKMLYQIVGKYDPFLLKVFVNAVGLFPPGSLILLDTDEIALVERANPDAPALPVVRIVGDRNGLRSTPTLVDLSQVDPSPTIVRWLDADEIGVNLADLILNDSLTEN